LSRFFTWQSELRQNRLFFDSAYTLFSVCLSLWMNGTHLGSTREGACRSLVTPKQRIWIPATKFEARCSIQLSYGRVTTILPRNILAVA
jgi:hypothetical protein